MASSKRDLVSLVDYTSEEILHLLNSAMSLKSGRLVSDPKPMAGKTGALIFQKPSLRTRVTFETAIYELGGHPITLSNDMIGLGKRESVADVARNLERWVHVIIARTFSHATIVELAKYAHVPVINALDDRYHPCQTLAFWQTLMEHRVGQQKFNIAFVGDGNNVCLSHMVMAAKLGHDLTLACPRAYFPPAAEMLIVQDIAQRTGSVIAVTENPADAVRSADAIYTDVWTSMGQEEETAARKTAFAAYQVNRALLELAPDDVLVSHCLPAHRGEEITDDVLDSKHAVAFDEAENRLHVQKAVITHLLS